MPLSFDDLRKTTITGRKDKRRFVLPKLLETPGEIELCEDFCLYYANLEKEKRTQKDFSLQFLTERAEGDFKLARGLNTAMLRYYTWESQIFKDKLSPAECNRLESLGLPHPSSVRLALYDYVNQLPMNGFGGATEWERGETLELFGAGIGLEPEQVEELTWLDAEENARLALRRRKDGELFHPPSGPELARHYNRLAIETLLYNSSEIIFGLGQNIPALLIKRIGFLSRELRVPYDLEYNALGEVQLRLYGPPEAFGPPTKHGERLSRLAFTVLALGRKLEDPEIEKANAEATIFQGPRTTIFDKKTKKANTSKQPGQKNPAPYSPLRSALGLVHLRDKAYHFDLLNLAKSYTRPQQEEEVEEIPTNLTASTELEKTPERNGLKETRAVYSVNEKPKTPEDFDSSVEAQFFKAFSALQREGQTTGWQIEREPEALAVPNENLLFIPDFALRRGKRQVWLEIVGFWTPSYRARKIEKLEKLKRRGGIELILAVDQNLKADFKEALFPTWFYKNNLKPTDLISLLNQHYADFEERLAGAHQEKEAIEQRVAQEGFLAEAELYSLLGCFNKTELLNALQKTGLSGEQNKKGTYIENYGLCSASYLARATVQLAKALKEAPGNRLTPGEAAVHLATAKLKIDLEQAEALITRLPGYRINRQSLFDVLVERITV